MRLCQVLTLKRRLCEVKTWWFPEAADCEGANRVLRRRTFTIRVTDVYSAGDAHKVTQSPSHMIP